MRIVFYCFLPLYVMMGMMVMSEALCFYESIDDLRTLQTMVGNGGDIKLYCPDSVGTKDCWKETLECFNSELFVLDFEYEGALKQHVTHHITKLKNQFDDHLFHLNASKGCQHCEIYEEKHPKIFLGNLEIFMQYHNHNAC